MMENDMLMEKKIGDVGVIIAKHMMAKWWIK
jgi:hypothetical protein